MIDAALVALEASAPAEYLRASPYAYPLVNAAHILGLAAMFGSILALDLRLLGAFPSVPAAPLARTLPTVAGWGLFLALVTGIALFSVQPADYLAAPAFAVKLGLIATGAAHALLLRRTPSWRQLVNGGSVASSLRASAAFSLSVWIGAILAGRWLAF